MDFISSLVSTSSESSCDESTGPTTPDGSPLFCPVLADDIIENRLSHFLGDSRQLEVQDPLARPKKLLTADDNTASHAMRHICVIGAGYVGRFHIGYTTSRKLLQTRRPVWTMLSGVLE